MSRLCSRLFKLTLGRLTAIYTEHTGILSNPIPIPLASISVMAPSTCQKLYQCPAQRYVAVNRGLAVSSGQSLEPLGWLRSRGSNMGIRAIVSAYSGRRAKERFSIMGILA